MLATKNGQMIALSTPAGARGWFHNTWTEGQGWERVKITAEQCPRISAEWLENERREHGDFKFGQEYECVFLDCETQLFDSGLIDAAFTDEVAPLWAA